MNKAVDIAAELITGKALLGLPFIGSLVFAIKRLWDVTNKVSALEVEIKYTREDVKEIKKIIMERR